MKIQIRRGVFETNSSSEHVFTHGETFNNLEVSEDGYVHVKLQVFNRDCVYHKDSASKLAYILLVAADFVGDDFWYYRYENIGFYKVYKHFKKSIEFERIEAVVKDFMNCKGIIIDESEGFIDHMSFSAQYYNTIFEWLDEV